MHYFFGQGEDSWLAGDEQEAVMGFAAEPARPAEATIVQGAIEAMARHRFGDETSQTFHLRAPAFLCCRVDERNSLSCRPRECLLHFHLSRPGGGSGNGHRASFRNPAASFRLPAFGFRFLVSAPGLRIRKPGRLDACTFLACGGRQVTSGWAPYRLGCITAFTTLLFRPIPVRRNLCAWDCKVTPASCACQEGNTIGCIPSNDGLDAGSVPRFPHCAKRRVVAIC